MQPSIAVRNSIFLKVILMYQIKRVSKEEIAAYRVQYLGALVQCQNLYLELMVEESENYMVCHSDIPIGYFIKTQDNKLVEFHLIDEFLLHAHRLFSHILSTYSIVSVYCKSFDAMLLDCCIVRSMKYTFAGMLFRDRIPAKSYSPQGYSVRLATEPDYDYLLQQEDGLYETPEELRRFLCGGNITLFEKDNLLYGCGYLIKVHENRDWYDIGMWVNPLCRRRGVGTMIISYLKETSLDNGWTPICACAYDNVASQRTLERNGFVSKYKLLEFAVDNNF
jgi:GNAT superfamily N-acetyltransferase